MMTVANNLNKIPKDREIYILCRRSSEAESYLSELGYYVINLSDWILYYKDKLVK